MRIGVFVEFMFILEEQTSVGEAKDSFLFVESGHDYLFDNFQGNSLLPNSGLQGRPVVQALGITWDMGVHSSP